MDCEGGPLALQLEDGHAGVVAGGEQVEGRMRRQDPVALVLAPERVQARALRHVPHADRLVLRVGQDQLLPRVEQHARHVVVVATTSVHFPRLRETKHALHTHSYEGFPRKADNTHSVIKG